MKKFDDSIYIRAPKSLKKQLREEAEKLPNVDTWSQHARNKLSKPIND